MKSESERALSPKWSLDIHVDKFGDVHATLRELGKMDTVIPIWTQQLPWFNALKNLIRTEGATPPEPLKEKL